MATLILEHVVVDKSASTYSIMLFNLQIQQFVFCSLQTMAISAVVNRISRVEYYFS